MEHFKVNERVACHRERGGGGGGDVEKIGENAV